MQDRRSGACGGALRLRGSGAGASALPVDPASASDDDLTRLFGEIDVENTGLLPVDTLVLEAKAYFDAQPTTQPETWIRGMVTKCDADMDGHLDLHEFLEAIGALRRC
jgi:Ca2+-binding EF-hand superfamily protein